MRNFNAQFKKAVGSGKAKDLIKAGKILSDVNQMITEKFFLPNIGAAENFKN
ncbi:hypothetical protein [Chryseobacterium luquanense]|uniref:Uncharacterized protein n=1 Tax=Chryseobacterium luquanense TaxID=2983766 RepID=A0ABT3Y4N9_9FLAO|nr:hypothetical protein [Chryseobacterium luquanense]MCX8533109.1 hypothetical protein [Chryseobacterium luquanense]